MSTSPGGGKAGIASIAGPPAREMLMRRREVVAALLAVAAAWPCVAQARPPEKVYRIAILHPSNPIALLSETGGLAAWRALFEELRRLGYEEGQNLVVERYSGGGRTERYAELAKAVVRSAPDRIFVLSFRMVQHLKEAGETVPIVAYTLDPVAFGFATSLARPGGNITGVDPGAGVQLWDKLLELLREVVQTVSRVGFLTPRAAWDGKAGAALRAAAQRTGIPIHGDILTEPLEAAAYRRAFATATGRVDALIVGDEPENYTHRRLIVELAERAPAADSVLQSSVCRGRRPPDLWDQSRRYVPNCEPNRPGLERC